MLDVMLPDMEGCDDYVTKPFSLEELVARIRMILRRAGMAAPESSRLVFKEVELDEETREITRAGAPTEESRALWYGRPEGEG